MADFQPSRLLDHYDWVVLGDNPGALMSACLAAQKGMHVLVLPLFASQLTQMTRSGQCVDPESNLVLGLGKIHGKPGVLGEIFAQLGILVGGLRNIVQDDRSVIQVATPNYRMGFYPDEHLSSMEWKRELGDERYEAWPFSRWMENVSQDVYQFWKGNESRVLGPRPLSLQEGLKKLYESWKNVNRGSLPYDLIPVARGVLSATTRESSTNPSLTSFLHMATLLKTAVNFRGGMSAYRRFLTTVARRLGVQIPKDVVCKRIFFENNRLVGIQVSQRGKMISVSTGVLGCSVRHARDYFYSASGVGDFKLKKPPSAVGWKFTLALTVHKEAIPEGFRNHVIWSEPGAPVVEVEVSSPEDYNLAGVQNRFIFVRTDLPFSQESLTLECQTRVAARLFRLVSRLMPFLEFHVVQIYPDFRTKSSPDDEEFSEIYGYVTPEIIPENLLRFEGEGFGFQTGIDGLFVATHESYPHLGSFGAAIAGVESVYFSEGLKKRKEVNRDRTLQP